MDRRRAIAVTNTADPLMSFLLASRPVQGGEVIGYSAVDDLESMRSLISQRKKRPNKAPEPTTMAVTPRAIVRVIEMKPQTAHRHAARDAPAIVVAHL